MVNKKKTKRITAIWKSIISHEMLPFSENDFYDSEWYEWLSRINAGFESEKIHLENLAEGASEEYAESLAEDYWQAEEISGNMYAALIVSVWARIENFIFHISSYCKCSGLPSIKEKPNIKCYADYFNENLGIDLQSVNNIHEANALRVLSNSFKHNDSYYMPDSFPIDEELAKKYGILEYRPHESCRIKYVGLPIKEMIIAAGIFCKDILIKTETVLKQRTKDE